MPCLHPFPPLGLTWLQIPVTQGSTEKCHHLANNRFTTQLGHPNLSAAYHYSWMRRQVNWVPLGRRGECRCVSLCAHCSLIVSALGATDASVAHFLSNPNHWPNETSWLQSRGQVCPLLLSVCSSDPLNRATNSGQHDKKLQWKNRQGRDTEHGK